MRQKQEQMRKNEKKWEQSQGKNEKKYDKDPSHFMTTLSYFFSFFLIFSHFFSFFLILILNNFDQNMWWEKMRKNEKKWEKIRYKFVKDQSNFSACGALLELVLKKKNSRLRRAWTFPDSILKKIFPPAAGSEFPRLY